MGRKGLQDQRSNRMVVYEVWKKNFSRLGKYSVCQGGGEEGRGKVLPLFPVKKNWENQPSTEKNRRHGKGGKGVLKDKLND